MELGGFFRGFAKYNKKILKKLIIFGILVLYFAFLVMYNYLRIIFSYSVEGSWLFGFVSASVSTLVLVLVSDLIWFVLKKKVKIRKDLRIIFFVTSTLILSGGVNFGILVATTWGEFKYSNTYFFKPSSPSPVEKVSINGDIGSIIINYNTTPTDHYVKLDLYVKIRGGFIEGKSFTDFFEPIRYNSAPEVNSFSEVEFELDKFPISSLFLLSQSITIDVTLRTDVIYDIDILSSTGSVSLNIPDNIVINNSILKTATGSISLLADKNVTFNGNVQMSTSSGSIALFAKNTNFTQGLTASTSTGLLTLNFTKCIVGNDIGGVVSTGNITLRSYNMEYSQNSTWTFETSTGSIDAEIYQFVDMGANVSGSLLVSTGSIDVIYKDNQAINGASFLGTWSTGSYIRTSSGGGFSATNSNPFFSLDYTTAISIYTLNLTITTGNIEIDGTSS
ncbi:hypothetical protein LCGC14_1361520 [marine sediment metagenome]|uniref:Adhesin domain-containing protein n=1 Tax=marine sediment metagenome TaxID=412755 RepID=A0A0F9K8N9_9ZZZZ|nr:hypothetical protein [archaeon]